MSTNQQGNCDGAHIGRILVVIDLADTSPGGARRSELLHRAVRVAKAAGAELELFYPCYDPSLALDLFASSAEVRRERERIVSHAATQLAELALAVKDPGLKVAHEVRWDHPVADAILRKIADSDPDIVMKRSTGPDFIMGLTRNTDWDLIRSAPSHLWFVKDQEQFSGAVLTSIGGTANDSRIITESDHRVFRIGDGVAGLLGADNYTVHCYEVPRVDAYATYAPAIAGAAHVVARTQPWQDLAEMHGKAIERFAEHFGIDAADIAIIRGHAADALPKQAEERGAALLVMGARNLGRWERVFSEVTAEPVLAEAPCDVLVVKEEQETRIPMADAPMLTGEPDIDVERAVVHPEKVFRDPMAVVRAEHLSGALRRRILEAWELDVKAQLRAEEEGGAVRATRAGVLEGIKAARRGLNELLQRRAG